MIRIMPLLAALMGSLSGLRHRQPSVPVSMEKMPLRQYLESKAAATAPVDKDNAPPVDAAEQERRRDLARDRKRRTQQRKKKRGY